MCPSINHEIAKTLFLPFPTFFSSYQIQYHGNGLAFFKIIFTRKKNLTRAWRDNSNLYSNSRLPVESAIATKSQIKRRFRID
jgi:hypothetical protein